MQTRRYYFACIRYPPPLLQRRSSEPDIPYDYRYEPLAAFRLRANVCRRGTCIARRALIEPTKLRELVLHGPVFPLIPVRDHALHVPHDRHAKLHSGKVVKAK